MNKTARALLSRATTWCAWTTCSCATAAASVSTSRTRSRWSSSEKYLGRAAEVDELVKQITERTGISETQARTAVDTVVGFLKNRLPEPIGNQVDSVLAGGANV